MASESKALFKNCALCAHTADKKCSACKKVAYCSEDHSKKAWKLHKRLCGYWSGQKPPPASGVFCGLCGLTNVPLRSTPCCDRLVCCGDDILDSQGCFSYHEMGTMCAHHYQEDHPGKEWDSCEQCADDFPQTEVAVWRRSNRFNFLEDIDEGSDAIAFQRSACNCCQKTIRICVEPFIKTSSGSLECEDCTTRQS